MASTSAVATRCENQSWLIINLTAYPVPAAPTCRMRSGSPIASNIGRTRATSSSSPPTKICSMPVAAPMDIPLTGASRMRRPRWECSARTRCATSGTEVDMSTHVPPSAMPARIPVGPLTTVSTCRGVGSIVMTTSVIDATSAGVAAHSAPFATSWSADSRRMSLTTRSNPAFCRLRVIPEPMLPRPMKPTRVGEMVLMCSCVLNR